MAFPGRLWRPGYSQIRPSDVDYCSRAGRCLDAGSGHRLGIEADYSWTSIKNTTFNSDSDPGTALDTLRTSSTMRGIGTLRTRSGLVVDNLLLYVTGGVAFANFKRSSTLTDNIGGVFVSETFSSNQNKWGWVGGFGTEWALGNNWSLKSEALYVHFEDDQKSFTSLLNGPPTRRFDHVDSAWMARVGVNYRFGGPVYAAY